MLWRPLQACVTAVFSPLSIPIDAQPLPPQIYNTNKLTLSLVGPQLKGDICALAAKGDLTFAATGGTIVVCKRVQK